MKHKFLGLLTFFTLLSSLLLTGCNNENKNSENTNTLSVSVSAEYMDYIKDIKKDFEKKYNVNVTVIEKDMADQIAALPLDGPAGKGPDVFIGGVENLGHGGHLLELNKIHTTEFKENQWDIDTIDEKIYGVPLTTEALVMFYNKDLVQQAPKTFKDLENIAKDRRFISKYEDGKTTGFLVNWSDFYCSAGLLAGYGGYVFGDDNTNTDDIGINNKGSIEGIEYAMDWYNKWPSGMLDNKTAGNFLNQAFIDKNTAVVINGPWAVNDYKDAGINLGIAPIPKLNNGKEYKPFISGKNWVVSAYTKVPDLAKSWVEYATNEENAYKLYKVNGEAPANQNALQKVIDEGDLVVDSIAHEQEVGVPIPIIREMTEVYPICESLMYDAVKENNAKKAADGVVNSLKDIIKQKYH